MQIICDHGGIFIHYSPLFEKDKLWANINSKVYCFLSIPCLYNPDHNFVRRPEYWQAIQRVVATIWFIRKVPYIQLHPGSAQNLGPVATIPSNQDLILAPPEVR